MPMSKKTKLILAGAGTAIATIGGMIAFGWWQRKRAMAEAEDLMEYEGTPTPTPKQTQLQPGGTQPAQPGSLEDEVTYNFVPPEQLRPPISYIFKVPVRANVKGVVTITEKPNGGKVLATTKAGRFVDVYAVVAPCVHNFQGLKEQGHVVVWWGGKKKGYGYIPLSALDVSESCPKFVEFLSTGMQSRYKCPGQTGRARSLLFCK